MLEEKLDLKSRMKKLIKDSQHKGIKLAIATATSTLNVKSLLRASWGVDIQDVFKVVVSGDTVKGKNRRLKYTK